MAEGLKETIFLVCMQYVEQRLQNAQKALESIQSSGEEETKSSAGDKFETSREMMKQEMDRNQKLLFEAQQMKVVLQNINIKDAKAQIGLGSLIQTNQGLFYLSIGIGKVLVDGNDVFVISPASPVGGLFVGKKVGDSFRFNLRKYEIQFIY